MKRAEKIRAIGNTPVEHIITHKNLDKYLKQIEEEPEFQIGNNAPYDPEKWYRQRVILEVPTGELTKDGFSALAIAGRNAIEHTELTGKEGFAAQGLEGKACIRKEFFGALMNMRDLIPELRGRIIIA